MDVMRYIIPITNIQSRERQKLSKTIVRTVLSVDILIIFRFSMWTVMILLLEHASVRRLRFVHSNNTFIRFHPPNQGNTSQIKDEQKITPMFDFASYSTIDHICYLLSVLFLCSQG